MGFFQGNRPDGHWDNFEARGARTLDELAEALTRGPIVVSKLKLEKIGPGEFQIVRRRERMIHATTYESVDAAPRSYRTPRKRGSIESTRTVVHCTDGHVNAPASSAQPIESLYENEPEFIVNLSMLSCSFTMSEACWHVSPPPTHARDMRST